MTETLGTTVPDDDGRFYVYWSTDHDGPVHMLLSVYDAWTPDPEELEPH